jgi:MFS family permease
MQGPLLVSYWGLRRHVSFGSAEYLLSAVSIVSIGTALVAEYGYDRFGPRKATALCLVFITLGFGLRPFTVGNFPATLILTIIAGVGLPLIVAPAAIAAQWFGRHRCRPRRPTRSDSGRNDAVGRYVRPAPARACPS